MSQEQSTKVSLSRDEVANRVKIILAEEAGMTPEELRDEHLLEGDLSFDSLTMVEVAMETEEEFDLQIPDEAMEGMRSVGQVIDAVYGLLQEQAE